MANIHQIINAPLKTEASSLGPVTIGKVYPAKATAKGNSYTNFAVSDQTGEAAMTVWGECPNLQEGSTVTFKGKIFPNEYQGKRSISAQNVTVEGGAVSSPSTGVSAAPGGREATIVRQNALSHATALVVAVGVTDVYSDVETVIALAKRFTHFSLTGESEPQSDEVQMLD